MSVVSDKYRGTITYVRVLGEPVRAAEYKGVTTYQDTAPIMKLPQRGSHMGREVGHILGEISEDEFQAGRSMLSAVAVNVNGKPGPGFFTLARELGRPCREDEERNRLSGSLSAMQPMWRGVGRCRPRKLPNQALQRTRLRHAAELNR